MGTLTGDTPALDGHCIHKLPTSCRLTATLDCCACQDKRPHAPTYNVYVDGIGMVSRGTRWQRYCWFCKTFWETRVRLEGFEPPNTKVPHEPDQSTFCGKWHDFHRGFRINDADVNSPDHTTPLAPERPWREVQPGHLPTLDQPEAPVVQRHASSTNDTGPHVSLDEMLDSLLDEEGAEQAYTLAESASVNHANTTGQSRVRADPSSARTANAGPSNELVQEAHALLQQAERRRRDLLAESQTAEQELRRRRQHHSGLLQAQAHARNMARNADRVWGTAEERADPGYTSPINSMFSRAWERYRTAEEVRAAERASIMIARQQGLDPATMRRDPMVHDIIFGSGPNLGAAGPTVEDIRLSATPEQPAEPQSLDDERVHRPPPKTDEEMRVSLACRICLQQVADTATLPCGHLVMCSYCAAIAVPTKDEAQMQPRRRDAVCPQCRRGIKRLARIFTA